jgi:hypothetical protein
MATSEEGGVVYSQHRRGQGKGSALQSGRGSFPEYFREPIKVLHDLLRQSGIPAEKRFP